MTLENPLFHTGQGQVAALLVGGRPAFLRHTWCPAVDAMPLCLSAWVTCMQPVLE